MRRHLRRILSIHSMSHIQWKPFKNKLIDSYYFFLALFIAFFIKKLYYFDKLRQGMRVPQTKVSGRQYMSMIRKVSAANFSDVF